MSGFRGVGLRRRVIRVAVRVQQERGFLKGFQKKGITVRIPPRASGRDTVRGCYAGPPRVVNLGVREHE